MTLDDGKIGKEYSVQSAALPLEVQKRMEALGMTNGTKIKLMRKKGRGTSVIMLRGTRFAVGRGITSKIEVSEAFNDR